MIAPPPLTLLQVTRARLLTHLRSSRYLSAEDLIFLIRDDRGKVNRLRTYLSWKDVRKRAKDDEGGAGGEGDVDIDDAGEWLGTILHRCQHCRCANVRYLIRVIRHWSRTRLDSC
jgi:hypothetical protein